VTVMVMNINLGNRWTVARLLSCSTAESNYRVTHVRASDVQRQSLQWRR